MPSNESLGCTWWSVVILGYKIDVLVCLSNVQRRWIYTATQDLFISSVSQEGLHPKPEIDKAPTLAARPAQFLLREHST